MVNFESKVDLTGTDLPNQPLESLKLCENKPSHPLCSTIRDVQVEFFATMYYYSVGKYIPPFLQSIEKTSNDE